MAVLAAGSSSVLDVFAMSASDVENYYFFDQIIFI